MQEEKPIEYTAAELEQQKLDVQAELDALFNTTIKEVEKQKSKCVTNL
jgi:hypothetical protein